MPGRRPGLHSGSPVDPRFMGFPLHFTEFSARSGHVAALATGGTLHTRLRSRGQAPRRPPAPAGRLKCRGIDAELNAAPWMRSVTRASCMTNVAANCSKRHRSADGYRTARSYARSNCVCICKCRRSPSAEIDHHRDNPSPWGRSRIPSAACAASFAARRHTWTNAFGAGNGVQFATERRRAAIPAAARVALESARRRGSWRRPWPRTSRKAPWLGHVDRIAGLRAGTNWARRLRGRRWLVGFQNGT
jgi:hypothetical protein